MAQACSPARVLQGSRRTAVSTTTLGLLPLALLLLLLAPLPSRADGDFKTPNDRNIEAAYNWLPLFLYTFLGSFLLYVNLQGPSFRADAWRGPLKEPPPRFPSTTGHESKENINRNPLFSRNEAMLLSVAIILAVPFFPNPSDLFVSDTGLVYNRVWGWFFWVSAVWALSKIPFLFARAPIQIAPLLHTFSPIWSPRFKFLLPHIFYGVVMLVLISAVFFDFSLLEASWVRYTWLPATMFNVALVWPVRNNIGQMPEKVARIVNLTTCVLTLVGAFLLTVLLDELTGASRKAVFIFFVVVTFSGPIGEIRKWIQVFVLRFIKKLDTLDRPLQWIAAVENPHGAPKTHSQERRTRFLVRILTFSVTVLFFAGLAQLFTVGTAVGERTHEDYSDCREMTLVSDGGWLHDWFGSRVSTKSLDVPWYDDQSSWNEGAFRLAAFATAFLAILCVLLAAQVWTAWWRFGFFGTYRNSLTFSVLLWSFTTVIVAFVLVFVGGRRITYWIAAFHNLAEVLLVYSLLFGDPNPAEPRASVFGGRAIVPRMWRYFAAALFVFWFVEVAFISVAEDLEQVALLLPPWGAVIDLAVFCTAVWLWQVQPFWLPPRPTSSYRWLVIAFAFHLIYVALTLANCALGPPLGRVIGILPLNALALLALLVMVRKHMLPAEAAHARDRTADLERLTEDPDILPRVQEIDADILRPGMQTAELELMPLDMRAFLPKVGAESVQRLEDADDDAAADADAVASAAAEAVVWTDDEQEDEQDGQALLAPARTGAPVAVELAETAGSSAPQSG